MSSELLISVRPNQTRVAHMRDKVLAELKVERRISPTVVGSIFKGKVARVLPGMQAAFVDIGLERAAFLYVGDVLTKMESEEENLYIKEEEKEEGEGEVVEEEESPIASPRRPQGKIQDLLTEGQEILVQVVKDPFGSKGARVTTHISLLGQNLVYMPKLKHFGVSRRIEDEKERQRLEKLCTKLFSKKESGGLIVRTAGEGATEKELQEDIEYLKRIWEVVEKSYEKVKNLGKVYSELGVELTAVRDILKDNVESIIVDNNTVYKRVLNFVSQFMPKYKKKVKLYTRAQPLFDYYDIDLEVTRALDRKVWLKSGGYIVIDEAEALVVIDVNTGKYVGKKDLEETIFQTNLEAIREIAYQLRIRNCSGIIILDLIDMSKEGNRERIFNLLEEELKKDRAKTSVVSMSELGLIEMTRKRTNPSLRSSLCKPCKYCEGKGYVKTKITVANEIFRALERESLERGQKYSRFEVHCHSDVADWIYEEDTETLEFTEKKLGTPIAFLVKEEFHIEEFEIKA